MKKVAVITLCLSYCFLFKASAQSDHKIDDALLMEYFQGQQYNKAVDYLKKSFPEPITDLKILTRLAYASHLAKRLPEAESYYLRAYQLDTTNQNILFNIAGINLKRGNIPKAEEYYKMIIARDTANVAVYSQLASIADSKHDTTAAVQYLQKANALNPVDSDIAGELGDYYISLQKFDDALKVLTKAAENDPENGVILMSMMKLNYSQKNWTETVNSCFKLIGMGINNGEVLNKLGIAYYNLKNYSCGAETFAQLKTNEQSEYTYYYAALCYKALDDYKQCIRMLNQSIEQGISPNIAVYYGEIAGSDEKLGKHTGAAAAYQKALQFSESPTIYYLLANLYDTRLKNKRKALLYYKKFLASGPKKQQEVYIAYAKSRIQHLKN
ncbi:MAG TPA: tetratricopeptide repeat protein [Mucilaginibacter sp.]|nr:tetratricopeptide repeat protein [Mucilaginibacter sp.]